MTGRASDTANNLHAQAVAPTAELLARAFNAAPNGFVLVDESGRIVAANAELEVMFGYAAGQLTGSPVDALLPGSLQESHVALRRGFFEKPERRAMGAGRVLYARRADGHEFPVEIGLNPVSGPRGPLVLAFVVDSVRPHARPPAPRPGRGQGPPTRQAQVRQCR